MCVYVCMEAGKRGGRGGGVVVHVCLFVYVFIFFFFVVYSSSIND